jgi:hypothetical protein
MTTAAIATYAYDQTRAELNAGSKQTTYESLESRSQDYRRQSVLWPLCARIGLVRPLAARGS